MKHVTLAYAVAVLALAGSAAAQETPQTGAPVEWAGAMLDPQVFTFVQAERLEGRTSGGETDQDSHRVWTATTIARARPHDPTGAAGWTATVEEGLGLPSAGPYGERLLPVQVDHRGEPSSAQWRGARDGGHPRM